MSFRKLNPDLSVQKLKIPRCCISSLEDAIAYIFLEVVLVGKYRSKLGAKRWESGMRVINDLEEGFLFKSMQADYLKLQSQIEECIRNPKVHQATLRRYYAIALLDYIKCSARHAEILRESAILHKSVEMHNAASRTQTLFKLQTYITEILRLFETGYVISANHLQFWVIILRLRHVLLAIRRSLCDPLKECERSFFLAPRFIQTYANEPQSKQLARFTKKFYKALLKKFKYNLSKDPEFFLERINLPVLMQKILFLIAQAVADLNNEFPPFLLKTTCAQQPIRSRTTTSQ